MNQRRISVRQAGRELGNLSQSTMEKLTGGIRPLLPAASDGRGVSSDALSHLVEWQTRTALPAEGPLILRVPKRPQTNGPSMYLDDDAHLTPSEKAERAVDLVEYARLWAQNPASRKYPYESPRVRFTGWWELSPTRLRTVLTSPTVVVATTGGFADEAAELLGHVTDVAYRNRKVLAVRPLVGDEAERFRLYLPGARQTPDLF